MDGEDPMTPAVIEAFLVFPMRLLVLPNLRVSRFAYARVVKGTRRIVGLELQTYEMRRLRRAWQAVQANQRLRLQVKLTREGPTPLDDDNCTGSFKPVRDAIATFFGIDDGRRDRWDWLPCEQRRGSYAVHIHIRVVETFHDYPTPKETNAIIRRIKKSRITPNVRKPR